MPVNVKSEKILKNKKPGDDDDDEPILKLIVNAHWQADAKIVNFKSTSGSKGCFTLNQSGDFQIAELHKALASLSKTNPKYGEFSSEFPAEVRMLKWVGDSREWEMESSNLTCLAFVDSSRTIDIAVLNKQRKRKITEVNNVVNLIGKQQVKNPDSSNEPIEIDSDSDSDSDSDDESNSKSVRLTYNKNGITIKAEFDHGFAGISDISSRISNSSSSREKSDYQVTLTTSSAIFKR